MNSFKNKNKRAIISYGIILYTIINQTPQYLIIRRKNSFGYMDFIKGMYRLDNNHQLRILVDEMTMEEKTKILEEDFTEQWKCLWGYRESKSFILTAEFIRAHDIFKRSLHHVRTLVNESQTNWLETEWEFPKGRMNTNEKYIECSLREFSEETGIQKEEFQIIKNILPFEENFIGSNNKHYIYKYYLAYMSPERFHSCNLTHFQSAEVSKLEWFNYESCLDKMRDYHIAKKQLIHKINNVVQDYCLYN